MAKSDHEAPRCRRPDRWKRKFYKHQGWFVAALLLATLAGCGPGTAIQPPAVIAGEERLRNGGFEAGLEGWTPSKLEIAGLETEEPQISAEATHSGAQGVRLTTPAGAASISALEQVISPTSVFTLDFWMRPQAGSSRIGLSPGDINSIGTRDITRLLFLNTGAVTATVLFTAWDTHYVVPMQLKLAEWVHVSISVDSDAGKQTLRIGDSYAVTLTTTPGIEPQQAGVLVFGDRQPRTDTYSVLFTRVQVTDGINGSFDYDDLSVRALK